MNKYQGCFISIEGQDAAGKTTNMKFIAETIERMGYEVVLTREPGGTNIAEEFRNMVLRKREGEQMVPMAELLTFFAARAQHVKQLIIPALQAGKVVISDRFTDSTYAYQGAGRGYGADVIQLERLVLKGFEPDFTLFFNITLPESERRLKARPGAADRLDDETLEFKHRVYNGYQQRLKENVHRMRLIDAMATIGDVERQLHQWLHHEFALMMELKQEPKDTPPSPHQQALEALNCIQEPDKLMADGRKPFEVLRSFIQLVHLNDQHELPTP